jgi:hypothetical protein
VVFSESMEEPARRPQLVGNFERSKGANLELPLTRHYFCIDARDGNPSPEANVEMGLYERSSENLVGTDATVVGSLRSWKSTILGESQWSHAAEKSVFLFDSEDRFLICPVLYGLPEYRTTVSGMRGHVGL